MPWTPGRAWCAWRAMATTKTCWARRRIRAGKRSTGYTAPSAGIACGTPPRSMGVRTYRMTGRSVSSASRMGCELLQDVELPTGIRKSDARAAFAGPRSPGDHPYPDQLRDVGHRAGALGHHPVPTGRGGGSAAAGASRPGPDTNWPTRPLVFWPYARLDEPRLHLEAGRILLDGHPAMPIFKVGCFCREGWVRYTRNGVSLTRRFTPQPSLPHTDLGCNVELFVSDQTIEMEILGPLAHLEPGQSCQHTRPGRSINKDGDLAAPCCR